MAGRAADSSTPIETKPDEWAASKYITFEAFTVKYGVAAVEKLALAPGERFIDIATGPGLLALHAAGLGAQVDAIDFAPSMIEALEGRLKASPNANVRAHVMDGQALEFDDATFDAACSSFGLILFPDYAAGLREMLRVLKPGGRAAVVSWSAPFETPTGLWLEMFASEGIDVASKLPQGWAKMMTEEGMEQELKQAGFVDVKVSVVNMLMQADSVREYCTGGAQNPAIKHLLGMLPEDRQSVFVENLISSLEGRYGAGAFEYPTRALIGAATKPS